MPLPRPLLRSTAALIGAVVFALVSCNGDPPAKPSVTPATGFDSSKAVFRLISGDRAIKDVISVVGFGPRPSGSDALEKCRVFIEAELKKLGWECQRQEFDAETPHGKIRFVNLRARFPVAGSDTWSRPVQALLTGHYDTKFFKDIYFVGANDAGSSTGLLIEIARASSERPAFAREVELVFFDGEEAFVDYGQDGPESMPRDGLYGSMHYAREVLKMPAAQRPVFMVNLDMVGDRDLQINVPSNTDREMGQMILAAAQELGVTRNFGLSRGAITDDHLPLGVGDPARGFANLRVTNLIDLDFTAWHTKGDTLEKLHPRSLEIAGQVATLLVEKYLLRR